MVDASFLHRELPVLKKTVHRLGLALNFGLDEAGLGAALDAGVNYLFWTPFRTGKVTPLLKRELARDREKYVIASGPTIAYFGSMVRNGVEKALRTLCVDYIDVCQLFWLGKGSAWSEGTQEMLAKLRDEGKIRASGISIHDRERAGKLVVESPIDLFMIRYNAAHPGAERDIFPNLVVRRPMMVAYTATDWRKLLKKPRGWAFEPMSAPDCYRFCLSSPHIDVALSGPASRAQLEENLRGLERGPLDPEEEANVRAFGKVVHG